MSLVPNVCSNPAGCQCAICKLHERPEAEPRGGMMPMPTNQSWAEYDLAVARRVRAADKLRAQRKRFAQRLAAVQAKLDDAEKTVKCLRSKIWDLEVRLKQQEDPRETVRAAVRRLGALALRYVDLETTQAMVERDLEALRVEPENKENKT